MNQQEQRDYTILDNALNGKPLDNVYVVDCHGHLDFWKSMVQCAGVDVDAIIERMDRIGIDVICLNKWNCPDLVSSNDDIGKALKKYPDRVVGFVNTEPALGRQVNHDELTRCFDELGFSGIKVHNGYNVLPLRDNISLPEFNDALNSIWEFANERKCPILCHGYLTKEIAGNYPDAKFLSAHAGGERNLAWYYKDCKNVYLDTAASNNLRGNIEYQTKIIGAGRILYGSDLPYAEPSYRLGQVVTSRIKDCEMRKILGENMAAILNLAIPEKYKNSCSKMNNIEK